ncbi:hypothetical protein AAG570_011134 [Ranatra chinensis]|uniref:Uncharacterized protein n=1 Tax=Ranatra chinensis TaxID=642074 RepID=A0ABD0YVX7_9HEMI
MASKRRNMFHKNKTQETTEKDIKRLTGDLRRTTAELVSYALKMNPVLASKRRHTGMLPQTRDGNVIAHSTGPKRNGERRRTIRMRQYSILNKWLSGCLSAVTSRIDHCWPFISTPRSDSHLPMVTIRPAPFIYAEFHTASGRRLGDSNRSTGDKPQSVCGSRCKKWKSSCLSSLIRTSFFIAIATNVICDFNTTAEIGSDWIDDPSCGEPLDLQSWEPEHRMDKRETLTYAFQLILAAAVFTNQVSGRWVYRCSCKPSCGLVEIPDSGPVFGSGLTCATSFGPPPPPVVYPPPPQVACPPPPQVVYPPPPQVVCPPQLPVVCPPQPQIACLPPTQIVGQSPPSVVGPPPPPPAPAPIRPAPGSVIRSSPLTSPNRPKPTVIYSSLPPPPTATCCQGPSTTICMPAPSPLPRFLPFPSSPLIYNPSSSVISPSTSVIRSPSVYRTYAIPPPPQCSSSIFLPPPEDGSSINAPEAILNCGIEIAMLQH